MRPVIWKPRYATRSMRERAWARRDAARERAAGAGARPSFWQRLRDRLR